MRLIDFVGGPERVHSPCLLLGKSAPGDDCPRFLGLNTLEHVSLGKEQGSNDVTIFAPRRAERTLSRHHAKFRVIDQDSLEVTDSGSTNGTRVNGAVVASAIVRSGDRVELGTFPMLVVREEAIEEFSQVYEDWRSAFSSNQRIELFSAIVKTGKSPNVLIDELLGMERTHPGAHHIELGAGYYLLATVNGTGTFINDFLSWNSPLAPLTLCSHCFEVFAPRHAQQPESFLAVKGPEKELAPGKLMQTRRTIEIYADLESTSRSTDFGDIDDRKAQDIFALSVPPKGSILSDDLEVPANPLINIVPTTNLIEWEEGLPQPFHGLLDKLHDDDFFMTGLHVLEGLLTFLAVSSLEYIRCRPEENKPSVEKLRRTQWGQIRPGTIGARANVLKTMAGRNDVPRMSYLPLFAQHTPLYSLLRCVIDDRNEFVHGSCDEDEVDDAESLPLCIYLLIDAFCRGENSIEGWSFWRSVPPTKVETAITLNECRFKTPYIGVAECPKCYERLGYLPGRIDKASSLSVFFPKCGHRSVIEIPESETR